MSPITNQSILDLFAARPNTEFELAVKRAALQNLAFHEIDAACQLHPGLDYLKLTRLVSGVIDGMSYMPASVSKHHCWLGGLVDHTEEVLSGALRLIEFAPSTDAKQTSWLRLVVTLAAVLHDYGKVMCYTASASGQATPETPIREIQLTREYTPLNQTHGHLSISYAFWHGQAIAEPLGSEVGHAILAHHQLSDWGSPVSPRSPAAWAVHLADMASVNISEDAYQRRHRPN